MPNIRITIADMEFRLETQSIEPLELLAQTWQPFLNRSKSTVPDVIIEAADPVDNRTYSVPISLPRAREEGRRILVSQEGLFELWWDPNTRRATLEYCRLLPMDTNGYGPTGIRGAIVALTSILLAQRGGGLLHGVGLAVQEKGCLLIGRSGAGKSTLAAMFPARSVLNDELVALTDAQGNPRIHGTPFSGTANQASMQSVPLALLCKLQKANGCRQEPLASRHALSLLMQCWALPAGLPFVEQEAFQHAIQLCGRVPLSTFCFPRDPRPVQNLINTAVAIN